MSNQQKIALEKNEASVWPYMEHSPCNTIKNEYKATFEFEVINKGVGPAIIDSVSYLLDGKKIDGWALGTELSRKYPKLQITSLGNSMLDRRVLAPGEHHSVVKIMIMNDNKLEVDLQNLLNNLDYYLEYCYCSIYGKCWKINGPFSREVSEDCQIDDDIR